MRRDMSPMPADRPPGVSRRAMLAGLAAALTAGCGKLAFMAANVSTVFGAYRRHADIAYGSHPRQRLDVYVPDAAAAATGMAAATGGSRPMVVFWHGGRWSFGDKAKYRFVGASLAELGYVAVLPNYRRYLMGHSAGAHLAALVALDARYFAAAGGAPPRIAGVIGLSGPYDFLPLNEADVQDMFGPPQNYPQSQPINFVRPDAPPMLLIHGSKDETVAPKNSVNLAASLRAVGVPVTLKLYPKLLHADTVAAISLPARGRAPTLGDVAAFVRQPRSS